MESSQIMILITVVVYLAAMLLIGVYFSRRGGSSSSHDFYLGGRSLGRSWKYLEISIFSSKGWRRYIYIMLSDISGNIWIYIIDNRDCNWKKDRTKSIDCIS